MFQNVGHLYGIGHQMSNCVKLGISFEPYARVSQLQTGSPIRLSLLFTIKSDIAFIETLEKCLHEKLSRKRLEGEWFNLSVRDAYTHSWLNAIALDDFIKYRKRYPSNIKEFLSHTKLRVNSNLETNNAEFKFLA